MLGQSNGDEVKLDSDDPLRAVFAHAAVGMAVLDAEGRFLHANPAFCRLTGYADDELRRLSLRALRHPDDRADGPVDEARYLRKGSDAIWLRVGVSPVRDDSGRLVVLAEDVTARRSADRAGLQEAEAAIAEQVRLAEYGRDVGRALTHRGTLDAVLARCAEATVRHLDGAFARIWTVNEAGDVLELRASAGMYTHTSGAHARVPVGQYKIGQIARERTPHLTNSVIGDPRVPAQDWARREGMVAFAGYPLVVDDRLAGVLAMFARHALSDATLRALASVADEIALGIERKRAEERLQRQREWLRVTLASIGDGVIATDVEGRVTFLNGVAEALTGWSEREAQGMPLSQVFRIVNEQDRAEVDSPAARALREGTVVGLANHTVLIARDGAERAIDDSAAPIRDGAGAVIGAVLVFREIEERRRSERALAASEARKAAILNTALDAIITMDHAGQVVEWNRAAERIFGYAREAAVGRDLGTLIVPPALRERHRRGMAHYLATGDASVLGRRIEINAMRADGAEFPVELAITRIPTDGPPLFTAHIRDITARRTAERRRAARLSVTETLAAARSLDEAAPRLLGALGEGLGWNVGALWIADDGSDVLRCGAVWHAPGTGGGQFAAATGAQTFAPGVGLPGRVWQSGAAAWIPDVIADDNFPRGSAAHADGLHGAFGAPIVLGGRTVGAFEFFSRRVEEPDADLLELMTTVGAQVGQAIGRWRGEAELRAAKEEAEAANQAKTQFLAVLSHELRTPLNPILLATSAMLERADDPDELRPTLQMIRQNVNLQARLIDDLLDVMRIVRGKMPLHWEIADCHRLLDQAVQICRSEVFGKVLRLDARLGAAESHVNADPARLQQVFWNLIKNAVKFTPEGGSITIRSRNEPGAGPGEALVVIEIEDSGIGVEPELLPRIFDPFQQGETTITRKFGGLGLGLAICKGIVDAHGGTIAVESAGRNQGTTFRVVLKALPDHALPARAGPAPRAAESGGVRTSTLRILVVEDEPTTLRLMARLLRGLGHEVTAAGGVAEATAALESNPFDLIVSDIGLPDGSGLELMRRAVKRRGHLPAIALTGYGMEEDIKRSREAGFTAHLTKPIDFAKLEAMIRQVAPTSG